MIRLFACLLLGALLARAEETAPAASAARDSNHFALELFARLATEPGNLAFSPYSVSSALAMTYAGARGATAEEMARVLHFPGQEGTHAGHEALRLQFGPAKVELAVANRLWAQRGEPFLPAFLQLTEKHYGAGLELVDFVADTEGARRAINAWVEKRTNARIRELVQPGVLSPLTELVLTNALYFKGKWAELFPANATGDLPFHLSATEQAPVPTMYRDGSMEIAEGPGVTLVELPYAGGRYAMVLLVPEAVDGLAALEERLDTAWLDSLAPASVQLYLPRFTVTKSFRLADTLAAMGMPLAFSGEADFSGMNGRGGIFISAVEHKAFVAVDETGTEAAAATAVFMKRGGGPRQRTVIRADRPFLFLIRDRETGCILFLGRVADPRPC